MRLANILTGELFQGGNRREGRRRQQKAPALHGRRLQIAEVDPENMRRLRIHEESL